VRILASAPTRIDLAGGTLDIWPLYLFHASAQTLNAAISLRAHAEVAPRDDGRLLLESIDTGRSVQVAGWADLNGHNDLPLLSRLAAFFRISGVSLRTRGQSPAGAGIAGSSALNVAVCGALAHLGGHRYSADELLTSAMNVEAQVINVPTGAQDYRPAYYGGIAAVELRPEGVRRVDLDVDPAELESRIALVYTGAPRNSGTNNWEITKRHIDGDRHVFDCFERIRDAASQLREALVGRDWAGAARQISAEWEARKQLAPGVTTPAIDQLIDRARSAGAQAAKVCGAGGGGCLFCLAEPDKLSAVKTALIDGGARVLEYRIETEGLTVAEPQD
jgi:D-glycero-alpha-D-manno-heptose-7-phosphate kinase